MKTDFIIIGSGLSGLTASLALQKYGDVLLISKKRLEDCATNLAQGGIAAVVIKGDSFESHIKDTLVAGSFHNNKEAVEYMVRNAPFAVDWLVKQGVNFEMANSHFSPTREAAHSFKRILHATDFTGREIEKALLKKVKSQKNIIIWENCFALNLLVSNRTCVGVAVIKDGKIINCVSRAVILATGGLGQLYRWTTNPVVATGDGIALGVRAGAEITDLEFIQFHPTALKCGNSPLFLLSEALRGEGAQLKNVKCQMSNVKCIQEGERFMSEIDQRGELAPRDIVARAIFREQQEGHEVFLDIRHKGQSFLKRRFPNIYRELKLKGFDLAYELVPVTPAAHYSCGGIKVDLYGRTSIKNLFAYGEVACTGVHGANRLASNSLLEAVVFPLLAADYVALAKSTKRHLRGDEATTSAPRMVEDREEVSKIMEIRTKLQQLMWGKVGIVREKKQLVEALKQIKEWEREIAEVFVIPTDPPAGGEWRSPPSGGISRRWTGPRRGGGQLRREIFHTTIPEDSSTTGIPDGIPFARNDKLFVDAKLVINQELAELQNMILVAKLITSAALSREKSLGVHFIT